MELFTPSSPDNPPRELSSLSENTLYELHRLLSEAHSAVHQAWQIVARDGVGAINHYGDMANVISREAASVSNFLATHYTDIYRRT